MTHDQPKPSEPDSPQPIVSDLSSSEAVPPESAELPPEASTETIAPPAESPANTVVQPFSEPSQKASSAVPPTQPTAPAKEPATTASSKLRSLRRMLGQLGGIVLAFLPIVFDVLQRLGKLTLKILKWIRSAWIAALPKIRTVLPENWNARLPDWALTGIALSVLALVLWISTSLLLPGKSPTIAQSDRSVPPAVSTPVEEPDLLADPAVIAKIQAQVAEVTDRYAEGLIQSVQANFRGSRLIVMVGQTWYTLDADSQDRLANEMLRRSRKLDFEKLEITDEAGTLIARSPVVGANMVVYERARGGDRG
ncbi:MAG: hypothetical protein HC769_08700 [Cyanobacteria bacterium CRU_2_1]|nr:hypothetical protein [Cyanobacteria bacterium RU_5_0]NJR58919.1 hypothetical protein [Cyanobacteria bacterium CRU_2_1]